MPALKKPILTLSILAAVALTEKLAVAYDGTVPASGATMQGIADADAAVGELTSVDMLGTTIAVAGGAIAVGDEVQVGTSGKLITQAAGLVVGRALQAAAADGDEFEVLLLPK